MSDETLITEAVAEEAAPEQVQAAAEVQQPAEPEQQTAPEQQEKPAVPEQYQFTAAEGKEYDADVLKEKGIGSGKLSAEEKRLLGSNNYGRTSRIHTLTKMRYSRKQGSYDADTKL